MSPALKFRPGTLIVVAMLLSSGLWLAGTLPLSSTTAVAGNTDSAQVYRWLDGDAIDETIGQRFTPPDGFERIPVEPGTFGDWLRGLPLKPADAKVYLYDGQPKPWQGVHAAVIDIDCGTKDLQQCADAVIRLHAEYLYGSNQPDQIHYEFTSGDVCAWPDWAAGIRPVVAGPLVQFVKLAASDTSYASFQAYLRKVFSYAGTLSLARELPQVSVAELQPGDVFVQGGSPGHAVLLVDVALNPDTNEAAFLLAQSYMPAQDIHVLKNLLRSDISPWYIVHDSAELRTPEWTFHWSDLRRFPTD